ncbi:MAG: Autoinducer 2 sensor kinase/phosphatase LuxQ [Pseudomonadota bacterium]|jgi:signal transduction histidine kinase
MSAAPPEPGLSADELLRLSPIWVGLDAALCVQARSPAADLLLGAPAPGTALNTSLSLRRPAGAETAARLCADRGAVLALHRETGLPLQGLALARGDGALLLLAPVADSSAALRAAGLQARDLGALDTTSSHLMRDQLLRTTLADAEQLAAALRGRNAELDALRTLAEQAQSAAERLAAARADFLATMSHELRTPLNGVIGTIELLGAQPLAPPADHLHAVLRRSAGRLRVIVDEVLDLARLEAGRLQLRVEPFPLDGMLAELRDDFAAAAAVKGVALRLASPPARMGWRQGDAGRLQQIVSNLLGNAVKFTSHGSISLRFGPDPGAPEGVEICVDDTGPGVAITDREAIFDPFRQLDGPEKAKGTGLGLAICRRLADAMGGTLRCEAAPTGGARFRLRLPLPATQAPGQPALPPAAPVRLAGIRVLLAEDNEVNQFVQTQLLEALGATVRVVGDGAAAMQSWDPDQFDVLLMDVHMPVMDGLEATAHLRAGPRGDEAVVVGLTAAVLPEDLAACTRAGMVGVVAKPMTMASLAAGIRAALDAQGR